MERAILARLTHLIPRPHQHSFAFCKGMGTAENLSYIHSVIDSNDSIIGFLDLEKALDSLARKCKELGLKINSEKTRALQTHHNINNQ